MLLLLAAVVPVVVSTTSKLQTPFSDPLWPSFVAWRAEHDTSSAVMDNTTTALRFQNFRRSVERVARRNAEEPSAHFGLDRWADLSEAEFAALVLSPERPASWTLGASLRTVPSVRVALPTKFDWRSKGVVTPVKDQGKHGTCWAFSATGVMEGINAMQPGNNLVSLSEQFFIDCCGNASSPPHHPLCAGSVVDTFSWEIARGGGSIPTELSYPYNGNAGRCRAANSTMSTAQLANFSAVSQASDWSQDDILVALVTDGPACIGIDGSCIQGYKSGVIRNCTGKGVDHAILLVGAGTTSGGVDYWVVKNSWGLQFGEAGYFRMERNRNLMQFRTAYFGRF